jgi:3-methyladenine DNA glycosylase AlkD
MGGRRALLKELSSLGDSEKAKTLQRFFKTGPGEYGEGDVFLGVVVPNQRRVARKFRDLPLAEVRALLTSVVHEHRLTALLILIEQFQKSGPEVQKTLVEFYLENTKSINNWDLVDLSAPKILGVYLLGRDRSILERLAKSESLWEKRIAILATYAFIKENQFQDTLKLAKTLLQDPHDLIHKAVGWMLREVGKRDQASEERFLDRHAGEMPRTMLRYAIERFGEEKRRFYLSK